MVCDVDFYSIGCALAIAKILTHRIRSILFLRGARLYAARRHGHDDKGRIGVKTMCSGLRSSAIGCGIIVFFSSDCLRLGASTNLIVDMVAAAVILLIWPPIWPLTDQA